MKTGIYIFTIYILALSLIPCGDGGGGIMEIAKHFFEIEHQHISDHEKHSNGCGDDTCSPFCICSCCSVSVNIPTNIRLDDKYIMFVFKKDPSYKSNFYPSGYHAAIWHPPIFS